MNIDTIKKSTEPIRNIQAPSLRSVKFSPGTQSGAYVTVWLSTIRPGRCDDVTGGQKKKLPTTNSTEPKLLMVHSRILHRVSGTWWQQHMSKVASAGIGAPPVGAQSTQSSSTCLLSSLGTSSTSRKGSPDCDSCDGFSFDGGPFVSLSCTFPTSFGALKIQSSSYSSL